MWKRSLGSGGVRTPVVFQATREGLGVLVGDLLIERAGLRAFSMRNTDILQSWLRPFNEARSVSYWNRAIPLTKLGVLEA